MSESATESALREPGVCGEHLYFDLSRPVRLIDLLESGSELLQLVDILLRSGQVAAAHVIGNERKSFAREFRQDSLQADPL